MAKDTITQQEMAFYKLYIERGKDPLRFVPTWEFGGEMLIEELNTWVLMSYKCPTRLTEIYQKNPGLLQRQLTTGRSGSSFYEYRINPSVSVENIRDPKLIKFYQRIKALKR